MREVCSHTMTIKPIGEYGMIGDMNSCALVGTDGSIDWCCLPRFDSPSVFAAILDDERGGRFQISPASSDWSSEQHYIPDTNILETIFQTPTGRITLTDFMPLKGNGNVVRSPHEVHRIVKCTQGNVDVRCYFQPRPDYARTMPKLLPSRHGVAVIGNRQAVKLACDVPLTVGESDAFSEFHLKEGDQATFVLAYGGSTAKHPTTYKSVEKLAQTRAHWEHLVSEITYDGLWRDEVVRSMLVLELMIYEPSGAIVAAPTTSLPEKIGGSRNWDYRFSWLRDSSFTMDVLYRMGHVEHANRYFDWLIQKCKVTQGRTRIVYGIAPRSSMKELTLDHFRGYRDSAPVRIGNAASRHLQLDVFGEVILGVDTLYRHQGTVSDDAWVLVESFAEAVTKNWKRKDRGVWEVRGKQQHFVYSKIMCWAALDRAASLADALGNNGQAKSWRSTASVIKTEILENGWDDKKQSFVQRYGDDALDASNLVIPFVGFLKSDDPRVKATLRATMNELADGPFVRRYIPDQVDDGFEEDEGMFILLSFWLIGNLIMLGRKEQAQEYFEEILSCANHLGLLGEMVHPDTHEILGNFPQAYSHIGLIHTARNLSRLLTGKPANNNSYPIAAD